LLPGKVTKKVIEPLLQPTGTNSLSRDKKVKVTFDSFMEVYRALLNDQKCQSEALKSDFKKTLEKEKKITRIQELMGSESLKSFLVTVQNWQGGDSYPEGDREKLLKLVEAEFMLHTRTR
jgi:DNA-binding transcriptional regulator YiaG